jgi:protein involved in polysaccharide export with SLBB domain
MNSSFSMFRILALSSCVLSLLLAGCGTSGSSSRSSNGSASGQPDKSRGGDSSTDILRVGDMVTITFSGVSDPPAVRHEERIKADGHVTLPLIGNIQAAGKTRGDLQENIRKGYVPRFYQYLTVNVQSETRVFYVDGMVRAPGRYSYFGEMTVLRGIAAAGDFNDFAKKSQVQLTRANGEKLTVDCNDARRNPAKDPPLYPDDQIFVPRRYW